MTDSRQLLVDYATNGSETAFRELVARYVDLVYSTSVRLVSPNRHLAEDVAQTVFANLARKAHTLPRNVALGGWLHRDTCFVASKMMRGERRRQFREMQFVQMNTQQDHSEANLARVAPILDEAINHLGAVDRAAILLRFYERLDFHSVARELGSTEAAAQKRVARALAKLQALLKHRGISFSVAALGTALASDAVTAAPAGLAVSISSASLAASVAGGAATFTLLKTIMMTKLKLGILGAMVVGLATPVVIHQQARVNLLEKEFQRQNDQMALIRAENSRLSNSVAVATTTKLRSDEELIELMRLRSQVGRLLREKKVYEQAQAAKQKTATPAVVPQTQATGPTSIPKESWVFAGYQTPGDAFQSMMWAMKNGDVNTFLASLSLEAQRTVAKEFANMSDPEISDKIQKEIAGLETLRLDRTKNVSETEVTYLLKYFETDDGSSKTRDEFVLTFKKVGSEWKSAGL